MARPQGGGVVEWEANAVEPLKTLEGSDIRILKKCLTEPDLAKAQLRLEGSFPGRRRT